MNIRTELNKLNEPDIWSMLLFALLKMKDCPEYSSISELAYILDRKGLLKLCEYFGGQTIKLPTIGELEELLYGLLMYQYVDIEKQSLDNVIEQFSAINRKSLKNTYTTIKTLMSEYTFTPRDDSKC